MLKKHIFLLFFPFENDILLSGIYVLLFVNLISGLFLKTAKVAFPSDQP